ncbi:MAG: 50S ribosomal protein L29 [Pseudomonadota bacterium]
MKPDEVREKSDVELAKLSLDLEEEVFRLRFRNGAGQLKQNSGIRKARRDLARVKTTLRERKLKEERKVSSR